jgi:hypothetical protein
MSMNAPYRTAKTEDRMKLAASAKNKKITRVARGIYAETDLVDPLMVYSLRYPYGIFTLETLFSIYNMTDRFIDTYWISTLRGSRSIQDDRIVQIRMERDLFSIGETWIPYEGGSIKGYDKERLLIELFRFEKRISKSLYKEIVQYYRKMVHQAFRIPLFHAYCEHFRERKSLQEKFAKEIL